MNKDEFYHIEWSNNGLFHEGFIRKDHITVICKDPKTGKAIIDIGKDNTSILIENSYEDTLIDLFNQ